MMYSAQVKTTNTNNISAFPLDRIYNEAYGLLIESRNYMSYILPEVRGKMAPEDRLFVTYQSTRLTSRLLEIMSWLLAQRAVASGEMSVSEAQQQGFSISNDSTCQFDEAETSLILPEGLRDLLERSTNLYIRLARLDTHTAKAA